MSATVRPGRRLSVALIGLVLVALGTTACSDLQSIDVGAGSDQGELAASATIATTAAPASTAALASRLPVTAAPSSATSGPTSTLAATAAATSAATAAATSGSAAQATSTAPSTPSAAATTVAARPADATSTALEATPINLGVQEPPAQPTVTIPAPPAALPTTTTTTRPPAPTTTTPPVPLTDSPIPGLASGPSVVGRAALPVVYAWRTIPAVPTAQNASWSFEAKTQFGSTTTFLITDKFGDFYQVILPIRENNVRGWVHKSGIALASSNVKIVVDVSERRVTAWEGQNVLADINVVVGKDSTPTPRGLFFVTDIIDTETPGGVYGPFVLALSARSEVFDFFNGGEPITALHGTNSPGLLGTAASNGCVRMPNSISNLFAQHVPLGTPVLIRN